MRLWIALLFAVSCTLVGCDSSYDSSSGYEDSNTSAVEYNTDYSVYQHNANVTEQPKGTKGYPAGHPMSGN